MLVLHKLVGTDSHGDNVYTDMSFIGKGDVRRVWNAAYKKAATRRLYIADDGSLWCRWSGWVQVRPAMQHERDDMLCDMVTCPLSVGYTTRNRP